MRITCIFLFILAVTARCGLAIGPHEVLLLANGQSVDSVEIAKEYMKLRNIPEQNMVRLDLPVFKDDSCNGITTNEFTAYIWEPAVRAMKERGLEDHILAWVYSVGFPIIVATEPSVSVQGLTFMRNNLPSGDEIRRGVYNSVLFGGPHGWDDVSHYSQTFDVYKQWLGDEMPLPSMMLGYTGAGGSTKEAVLAYLVRGVEADGRRPAGTVYFVTSDDVRSKCREWQFNNAVKELKSLGVKAVIVPKFPAGADDVMGLMMGAAIVTPQRVAGYLPGCMAEHLTSAAGVFKDGGQTKLTAWLEAGATASAGTVTEPFSIWAKFPNARFFTHYASGCSMIESFFQSVMCPLQILFVGEPLAQPWVLRDEAVLSGIDDDAVSGVLKLKAVVKGESNGYYSRYMFLLDGRRIGVVSSITGRESEVFQFDSTAFKNGEHLLRVVAYRAGLVRIQVFDEKKIVIRNGN